MAKYNGHRNWNHWNVALWIGNDEGLYNLARECITQNMSRVHSNRDKAAADFVAIMAEHGKTHTPDGAPYTKTSVRAAMVGL